MDCLMPGHAVKSFCASIGCLGRIGKDLYFDFDPMDGLALRTVNEAKSAFCVFEFRPSFFERCTTPPNMTSTRRNNNRHGSSFASSQSSSTTPSQTSSHKRTQSDSQLSSSQDRFSCRVPVRALTPVVRNRKNVVALRIRSDASIGASQDDGYKSLQLAFEFHLQPKHQDGTETNRDVAAEESEAAGGSSLLKVIHRIGVADADSLAAVTSKDECSQIRAPPRVLLRLLEPLKRTTEAALVIEKNSDVLVATSFHHPADLLVTNNNTNSSSSVLSRHNNLLKTETTILVRDLDDLDFRDDRSSAIPELPSKVNEQVILVFSMREAQALLQFCCRHPPTTTSSDEGAVSNNSWTMSVSFHWGGRPILWETTSQSVSVQLVLATLDHKVLEVSPQQQ